MPTQEFETEEELDEAFERTMERMQDEADKEEEEQSAASVENILQVEWHYHVNCPKCDAELDLSDGDYDDDNLFSKPIFSNKWEDISGTEVTCGECEYEFEIHKVEPW